MSATWRSDEMTRTRKLLRDHPAAKVYAAVTVAVLYVVIPVIFVGFLFPLIQHSLTYWFG